MRALFGRAILAALFLTGIGGLPAAASVGAIGNGAAAAGSLWQGSSGLTYPTVCDQYTKLSSLSASITTAISGSPGKNIYVCNWMALATGTNLNVFVLYHGTPANCAGGGAPVGIDAGANQEGGTGVFDSWTSAFGNPLFIVPTGDDLCVLFAVNGGGTLTSSIFRISYAIY